MMKQAGSNTLFRLSKFCIVFIALSSAGAVPVAPGDALDDECPVSVATDVRWTAARKELRQTVFPSKITAKLKKLHDQPLPFVRFRKDPNEQRDRPRSRFSVIIEF